MVTVPVKVRLPAVVTMLDEEPSVILPCRVLSSLIFLKAPMPATPEPFNEVMGSAIVRLLPFPSICKVASLDTVVAPAVVPKAVSFWTDNIPAVTAVAPVYVLARVRIAVPLVFLVNVMPAPPRIALTVPLSRTYEVPVNIPAAPVIVPLVRVTVPTVSEKPAISRVPPETVTAPVFAITLLAPY